MIRLLYLRRRNATVQEQALSTSSLPTSSLPPAPTDDKPIEDRPDGVALLIVSPTVTLRAVQYPEEKMSQSGPLLISCPRKKARAQKLMRQAYEDYSLGATRRTNLHIVVD